MKLHKIIMYNTSEIEKVEGKKEKKTFTGVVLFVLQ